MPLVDPIYEVDVNRRDGVRRSWDPAGRLGLLVVERASLGLEGGSQELDPEVPPPDDP